MGGVAVTSSLTSFPVYFYFRSSFLDLTHSSASKSVDKHGSYGWKSRILCQNLDTRSTNRSTRHFFGATLLTIFFNPPYVQSSSGCQICGHNLDTTSTNRFFFYSPCTVIIWQSNLISIRRQLTELRKNCCWPTPTFFLIHHVQSSSGCQVWSQNLDTTSAN